jgi:hypothetical protein
VFPVLLIALGCAALTGGFLVLLSYGPRYRVARLLATTYSVSVEDARTIAERGERRYVRVDGRVDSEENFEDERHRPLVFRRSRLEARSGPAWRSLGERREHVPFDIREGLAGIAIDGGALDAGLVVVPRESVGLAADAADRVPPEMPPTTPIRLRIDQVSSVEHAIVLGVPVVNGTGEPHLTAGLGRPLVLTTLEPPEAMRILAGGRTRPRIATGLFVVGLVLAVVGVLWLVADAVL